ncbi:MAG: hypothetical protein HGA49_12710 [Eubacteriaceae bacterium]|nr:hypothetical protein [Eubacteriaceae bacterium]
MGDDIWIEAIKIVPSILWFLFAVVLIICYREQLVGIVSKIDGFEFGGFKLNFLRDSFNGIIDMAEKNKQWKVIVPEKDKDRALKRALRNKSLFEGSRLLWVDDCPENNNNERRMFQKLGAYCDFAQSTESAIQKLRDFEYNFVISDMKRGANEQAGLDMLELFDSAGIRIPVIVYLGLYDVGKPVPAGLFGITNRPDELLHLMIDVLERNKDLNKS